MTGMVTREVFEAFIAATPTQSETTIERDGAHSYEIWHDLDGREVGYTAYRDGEAVAWTIVAGTWALRS